MSARRCESQSRCLILDQRSCGGNKPTTTSRGQRTQTTTASPRLRRLCLPRLPHNCVFTVSAPVVWMTCRTAPRLEHRQLLGSSRR
eukprot:504137-Amphidinium_carterae.1